MGFSTGFDPDEAFIATHDSVRVSTIKMMAVLGRKGLSLSPSSPQLQTLADLILLAPQTFFNKQTDCKETLTIQTEAENDPKYKIQVHRFSSERCFSGNQSTKHPNIQLHNDEKTQTNMTKLSNEMDKLSTNTALCTQFSGILK